MKQIAYLYSNPATANLVSSIDEYRLVSSWVAFNTNISSPIVATHEKEVPWIRQPSITPIKSKTMTKAQDSHYHSKLVSASRFSHKLVREPNAWMKAFGVTDTNEIKEINNQILEMIEDSEQLAREIRIEKNQSVIGVSRLVRQAISVTGYKPKKNNSRIFVISSDKDLRISYIKKVKFLFEYCKELYKQACKGIRVVWPPGVFPASHTPLCSALA